jgi:hypothetical protein
MTPGSNTGQIYNVGGGSSRGQLRVGLGGRNPRTNEEIRESLTEAQRAGLNRLNRLHENIHTNNRLNPPPPAAPNPSARPATRTRDMVTPQDGLREAGRTVRDLATMSAVGVAPELILFGGLAAGASLLSGGQDPYSAYDVGMQPLPSNGLTDADLDALLAASYGASDSGAVPMYQDNPTYWQSPEYTASPSAESPTMTSQMAANWINSQPSTYGQPFDPSVYY